MTHLSTSFLDIKNPYQSISLFTKGRDHLLVPDQILFIEEIEKSFSEWAYYDTSKPISKEGIALFTQCDAQALWGVLHDLDPRREKVRGYQLLANITKVFGIALEEQMNSPRSVYQVVVPDGAKGNTPQFWGWMEGRYVAGSEKLRKSVSDGRVLLKDGHVTPSALRALQRLQTCEKTTQNLALDMSLEEFVDLMIFAHEWKIEPLLGELRELYEQYDLESRNREEKTAFKRAMDSRDDKEREIVDKVLSQAAEPEPRRFDIDTVTFALSNDEKTGSSRFDEKKPYDSLIRFAERCSALPGGEQTRFLFSARRYFTRAACWGTRAEIPKKFVGKFVHITLPFLLNAMRIKEHERQRLLAGIQRVTGKSFPQLPSRDQLLIIDHCYTPNDSKKSTQMGWVPASGIHSDEEPSKKDNGQPVAPLETLKITGSLPINFANLPADSEMSLGTPAQVVATLLIAWDFSLASWKKRACAEIDYRMVDEESREEMSTMLAKVLHREKVRVLLANDLPQDNFLPNVEQLSKKELHSLLMFFQEINEECTIDFSELALTKEQKKALINFVRPDSSPGTPEEVLNIFQIGIEYELNELAEAGCSEIHSRLQTPLTRRKMSNLLVKDFSTPHIQTLLARVSMGEFRPDTELLDDEQCLSLLEFRVKRYGEDFTAETASDITPEERRFNIIDRFHTTASPTQQEEIASYYRDCILDKIPCKARSYHKTPQRRFVDKAFERLVSYPQQELDAVSLNSLVLCNDIKAEEDFRTISDFLRDEKIIGLCDKAGLSKSRAALAEVLLKAEPTLIAGIVINDFMQTFFPSEMEKRPLFEKMLEQGAKCDTMGEDERQELVSANPLSNEEIIRIHEVLKSEQVETWLKEHAPQVDGVYYLFPFEKAYQPQFVEASGAISRAESNIAKKEGKDHSAEGAFLDELIRWAYSPHASQDAASFGEKVWTLKASLKIGPQETEWLDAFLKKAGVKELFELEQCPELYPWLSSSMERSAEATALASEFVKLDLFQDTSYAEYARELFEFVYTNQIAINRDTAQTFWEKYKVWDKGFIFLALGLENPEVKNWLDTHAGTFMGPALYASIEIAAYDLPVLLDVHKFIEAVKLQGLLTEKPAARALDNSLKAIGRASQTKPTEMEKLKKSLQETAQDLKLTTAQNRQIKNAIESHHAQVLTHGSLPRARELLLPNVSTWLNW